MNDDLKQEWRKYRTAFLAGLGALLVWIAVCVFGENNKHLYELIWVLKLYLKCWLTWGFFLWWKHSAW